MLIYGVRVTPTVAWDVSMGRGHAGGAFALNHALNLYEIAQKFAFSSGIEKYMYVKYVWDASSHATRSRHADTPRHKQKHPTQTVPTCLYMRDDTCVSRFAPRPGWTTGGDDGNDGRMHATGAMINKPWRWRAWWSSSARRRRESTASISIVKCAGDPCADSWACAAPRRSSDRSTASATPPNRPASSSTRTPSTSLKQMASVCHRLGEYSAASSPPGIPRRIAQRSNRRAKRVNLIVAVMA